MPHQRPHFVSGWAGTRTSAALRVLGWPSTVVAPGFDQGGCRLAMQVSHAGTYYNILSHAPIKGNSTPRTGRLICRAARGPAAQQPLGSLGRPPTGNPLPTAPAFVVAATPLMHLLYMYTMVHQI
jgi:hypothetical protein